MTRKIVHLITEKARHVIKSLKGKLLPIALVRELQKSFRRFTAKRADTRRATRRDDLLSMAAKHLIIKAEILFLHANESPAFGIGMLCQHLSVCRARGPSVFIVDPKFHTDRFRIENDLSHHLDKFGSHIIGSAGIKTRMKDHTLDAMLLHLQHLFTQGRCLNAVVDRPKAQKFHLSFHGYQIPPFLDLTQIVANIVLSVKAIRAITHVSRRDGKKNRFSFQNYCLAVLFIV